MQNTFHQKQRFDLIYIFLLAFAIRLTFVFVINPLTVGALTPDVVDPDGFGARAVHILEGRGFINVGTGKPEIERDPFYSYFLAGVWKLLDRSKEAAQVINSALGGITAVLTYLLAYSSFGRKVGWGAALLYSCFPLNIWYVPFYRYEALSTPLLALGGILFLELRKQLRWRDSILLGVVLGLGALTLSSMILIPLIFFAVSFKQDPIRKKLLVRLLVALVVMAGVIFPWSWRNYTVTNGEIIPVRQGGAAVFLQGNYAAMHFTQAPLQLTRIRELAKADYNSIMLAKTGASTVKEINPVQQERILRQEIINFLRDTPWLFAWKLIFQSVRFWYIGDTIPKSLFVLCIQLPVLILALGGAIQAIRTKKPILWYLLVIAYFNLAYAAIWVEARYSVPLEPYLMTLASYGLFSFKPFNSLWERLGSRFQHEGIS